MSKHGMKVHKWTDEDIEHLRQAVKDCEPIFRLYTSDQNAEYGDSNAWDAVAGRLAPGIVVTGNACLKQWKKVREVELRENHAMTDGWMGAVVAVQEYEQSILERAEDRLEAIDSRTEMLVNRQELMMEKVDRIEAKLDRVLLELGVSFDEAA